MPLIKPFKGVFFNEKKVGKLDDVITPPYDVISDTYAQTLMNRSPYNFAHLDLPQATDPDYKNAAERFQRWKEDGALLQDSTPHYYWYRQVFEVQGKKHQRDCLMALVQVSEFGEGKIRPHENTYGRYKSDRLQLLKATSCNFSHIFGMVKDEEGVMESEMEKVEFETPAMSAVGDDKIEHIVWKVEAEKATKLERFFRDNPIYIVDGHHRYESSVMYSKESGALGTERPEAYMLFAIANVFDPGLIVLPTHRVLRSLGDSSLDTHKWESQYELKPATEAELKAFTLRPKAAPSFGLSVGGKLFLATPRHWETAKASMGNSVHRLSVAWSDRKFLTEWFDVIDDNRRDKIIYDQDTDKLLRERGKHPLIVFHAPVEVSHVTDVADENQFMPQKTTFFYPKIGVGLVLREIV